jgi:DNA-binding response OmpR family regulator
MSELANMLPLRVLVVDDCADAADSLAALVRLWGYRPVVAYDGGTAQVAAQANPPDVVLLDLALPVLDGLEVARWLRRQPGLCGVLVVAVTGYGDESFRHRADEAGFDWYLVKPIDLEWLQRLLALCQEARGPLHHVVPEALRNRDIAPALPASGSAPGNAFGG